MVTNKEIKAKLSKKLGIAEGSLYKLAKKAYPVLYEVSVAEAVYVFALDSGVGIKRHISSEMLERVAMLHRNNRPATSSTMLSTTTAVIAKRRKTSIESNIIKMPTGITIDDPLLPNRIKKDAMRMAGIYPLFYYLENSIRSFITVAMDKYEGPDWWKKIDPGLIKKVNKRKDNEHRNAWHQKRSSREIDYLDFSDLMGVLSNKSRRKLKNDNILPSGDWIDIIIRAVKESRNVIAHMNPLTQDSVRSVEVRVKEYNRQIKAKHKYLIE